MTVAKKWTLAGALALASLAVWVPQLLARSSAPAITSGDGGNAPAFPAEAVPGIEAARAPAPPPLERIATLESLLPQLRNFGVGRPRPELEELLARLAPRPEAEVAVATSPTAASVEAPTPFAELVAPMRVSACLLGAKRSSAVLDGRVVRVGDDLDNGVVVDAIRARSVVLRRGDERAEIALTRATPSTAPLPTH